MWPVGWTVPASRAGSRSVHSEVPRAQVSILAVGDCRGRSKGHVGVATQSSSLRPPVPVCLFWVGTLNHMAQCVCGFGGGGWGDPSVVRSRVGVMSGRGQLVGSSDSSLEEKGLPCLLKGGCSGAT